MKVSTKEESNMYENTTHEWKCLVIVPAFNEEKVISKVIDDIRHNFKATDIVVINDGSTDKTADNARQAGAKVINLTINLGIGGAVQTGFMYAHQEHYDVAIQFDGDGQHMGDQITSLTSPILSGEADVVIGSRFLDRKGYSSSFMRRFGIIVLSSINSFVLGQKITDSTSGFRAYNKCAIEFLSSNYPQDYPEPESINVLVKNGFRIKEVYVKMMARMEGNSSITSLLSIYYMLKVMLAILVGISRKSVKEGAKDG